MASAAIISGWSGQRRAVPGPAHIAARASVIRIRFLTSPYVQDGGLSAVYGNTIGYFARSRNSDRVGHVVLGSLSPWHNRIVTSGRGPEIALSAKWLVWDDTIASNANQTTWAIHAMNRATGKQFIADSSADEGPDPAPAAFDTFALYGDELVWSYNVCHQSCARGSLADQGSRIALVKLGSRHSRILYSTRRGCSATFVSVWANTVAWHDEGACWPHRSGSNIMMENLATRRVSQLTHNGISSTPATNGRYVAWS
ncbi:MAG TPA: hypothetical protein VG815_07955, partial [Chloroflexota bacterium]|nr:hypothetical protein [Chloroflexota bacterium]